MSAQVTVDACGPSAGPLPSRPAIPSGDRPTYASDEGLRVRLERALIRSEIEALNMEFAYLIDHNRSDEVPLLFTEDGSYGREGGGRSTGREALTQVYALRAARGERTARHLFTNLRLEYVSECEVHGQTILLLYAEDGPPPHPAEATLVSDYRDVYRLGDDGRWRYASRTVTHQFKHPGNKPIVLPLGQG